MNSAAHAFKTTEYDDCLDRPGWIPPEIGDDWDPNPYAYQTEEELMPAGGLHGQLLAYISMILNDFLESQGKIFLIDTFMLYRDANGVKQRISPDLMLLSYRSPIPPSYDLDIEPLPPACIVEITSPKSRMRDIHYKLNFYTQLGTPTYFVIDAVTSGPKLKKQIELHLWRKIKGQIVKIPPNPEGFFILHEIRLKIKAVGQQLIFEDQMTGEKLKDFKQFKISLQKEQQRADDAQQRADDAQKRADRLAERLRSLGITDIE